MFAFASPVLSDAYLKWIVLYCGVSANHCVMDLFLFLLWAHLVENVLKLNIPAFDPPMRESAYQGVVFPLPYVIVRFVLEPGVDYIVGRTR